MEIEKTLENIGQSLEKYATFISSDDSDFRSFLEESDFEGVFRDFITPIFENTQNSEALSMIVPIAKFLLTEYLLAFNISCMHHLLEEYEATQDIVSPFNIKEVSGVYTIDELYNILKNLDDQSIRRFLIYVDDVRFSDLYKSVRSSDFESFRKLMGDKSTMLCSKLVEDEVFRFDFLSEKIVNSDNFFSGVLPFTNDLGLAVYPAIAECSILLENIYDWELCSFRIEKCKAFMDTCPVAMSEISKTIVQIQSCEYFSIHEKKDLLDVSAKYSFLFENVDLTLHGQSPENMEVINRKAIKLGKAIHASILDELNSDSEKYNATIINQESNSAEESKIEEFVSSNFIFENEQAERYFKNNYLANVCSYISSIRGVKDFQELCYLIYPFDGKSGCMTDTIKKHLTGGLSWREEPVNKIICAQMLYEVCPNPIKEKIKDKYEDFKKYPQGKLRKAILEKAMKQEYKWMIGFIEDYWPIQNGEHDKDFRKDMLREYKRLNE